MAGFVVREKKADGTPREPKPFKEFSIPSVKLTTLDEADKFIAFFQELGADDVVTYLKGKTAKFR